mgnify:CR=1 FL=1
MNFKNMYKNYIENIFFRKYLLINKNGEINILIDGIICINDAIYPRSRGNPAHAFAFKMVLSDQVAESTVVDVIWTPSKDGYLKPRVQIEPINLGGVCIEYATGFNGSFINDNKILFAEGNVIKYICRHQDKGKKQDLLKAIHYIEMIIERDYEI